MTGHEKRTLNKQRDILNATKHLIFNNGLKDLTILKIAKKAKVSHVTIYNIFGGKDNLVNKAIIEHAEESVDEIITVLKIKTKPENMIRNYFTISFEQNVNYPKTKEVIEYIFSDINHDLTNYINNLDCPLLIRHFLIRHCFL